MALSMWVTTVIVLTGRCDCPHATDRQPPQPPALSITSLNPRLPSLLHLQSLVHLHIHDVSTRAWTLAMMMDRPIPSPSKTPSTSMCVGGDMGHG
jgi:hypothetical protein